MKKARAFLFFVILLIPVVALSALQDTPAPRLEITSVDASQMPTVTLSANVYDALGQPLLGLTAENFELTGDLAENAQITNVENITDNNLPIATVLMIDVSSSMESSPIENARIAAQAFIDNIGPNDPVAIMTFGSSSRLVQDYTTDKAVLSAVIASLNVRGETALYQGAYDAIEVAAASPTPRRAVILLSDGGEYGGRSTVGRDEVAAQALERGVPVYTIGLGFGIDRTFLNELSSATGSQYYESPAPEELTQIYTDLAAKLRSQYVITLETDLPLDGTQYTLGLRATTPQGTADAAAVLRAPIPVPIVQLPALSEPLTEATEIRATLLADDPVDSVIFQINDDEPVITSADSPAISIDPVGYLPGDYLLTVSATDEDGDTGTEILPFTIGALASQIAISPDPSSLGEITRPQTISVDVTGQTVTTAVSVAFDDAALADITETGSFTINPLDFAPGEHSVTLSVTNEGGATTEQVYPFTIGAVRPEITVVGLENGQIIDAPITFSVEVVAQGPVAPNVSLNEVILEPDSDGNYSIDPLDYPPGNYTLNITASDVLTSNLNVNFTIGALPPQISITGLEAGETISEDRVIRPSFVSQSPVIHLAVFVDETDLAHLVTPPFNFTLRVLDFAPGEHVLRLIADNSAGATGTLEVPFTIGAEPAATATQGALITATQQAQATQVAVQNVTQVAIESATSAAQSTQVARATSTQVAIDATASQQAIGDATSTQVAINDDATQSSVDATATQVKVEATASQAAVSALNAGATATQRAEETAEALAAAATATQVAEVTASALNAQATATQLARDSATEAAQLTATQVAEATAEALAANATVTQAALETRDAQSIWATATQIANELATDQAQTTATSIAQATLDVQASATQAAANATATEAAATQNAAQATATQAAQNRLDTRATALAQAQAAAQVATRNALATANAESRQQAQATQDSRATRNARATATQAAQQTATDQALGTATVMQATQAILDATQAAQETLNALEATATGLIVNATETRNALETQSADNATATQSAQDDIATSAAEQALNTQAAQDATATRNALATATRAAPLTATALVIVQAAQATADASATAVANVAATNDDATRSAGSTATTIAQATLDTRLTAVGPTSTQAESGAQDAPTLTPSPQPTLTEVQTGEAAAASNIAPIAIIVIVIIVIIVALVLIMRGRGSPRR